MKTFSFFKVKDQEKILKEYLSGSIKLNKDLINSLLIDSCYYPASYTDTTPIQFLKNINSFVYCDYSIKKFDIEKTLNDQLVNFELLDSKFINPIDINFDDYVNSVYGLTERTNNLLENIIEKLDCFIYWSIWKSGSRIISIIYISWEAIDCYTKLYVEKNITPKVISIIQPGHTMGGNWTNFFNPAGEFYTALNKSKLPDFMLLGTYEGGFYITVSSDYLEINKKYAYVKDLSNDTRHKLTLCKLDKRNILQKERHIYRKILKQENEKKERLNSYKKWWKIYMKKRLQGRNPPIINFRITREEELKRQNFDKKLSEKKLPYKLFNAIKRSDKLAIKALISKNIDITSPISKTIKISPLDYSRLANKENLLQ